MGFQKVEFEFPDEKEEKCLDIEETSAVEIDLSGKKTEEDYKQSEPEVEVEASRCERRGNWWCESSSYDYKKKLKLYTKRGKKYSQMTVGSFLKKYKEGTFILSVRAHTFTVKDGVVCGLISDGKKMRVPLEKVWQIV